MLEETKRKNQKKTKEDNSTGWWSKMGIKVNHTQSKGIYSFTLTI